MPNPKTVRIPVPGTRYSLVVDTSKGDCNKEDEHCHVNPGHIAKIKLRSCTFESIPRDVSHNDQRRILDTAESYRYELIDAYLHNRVNGSD